MGFSTFYIAFHAIYFKLEDLFTDNFKYSSAKHNHMTNPRVEEFSSCATL